MKTKFLALSVMAFFGVAYLCANLATGLASCQCSCSKQVVKAEPACSGDGCSCDDKKKTDQ